MSCPKPPQSNTHLGHACNQQAVMRREGIIRALYRSEVQWLVAAVQSRALGRRLVAPEMQV